MKKALVFIVLMMIICTLGVLVACESKTNYPIDFPQDKPLPEGIESITPTNGAALGDNGYFFNSGKGGSFFVSVKFKPGYEEGNFAVFADGKQLPILNKNELDDCLYIDYEVYPTARVAISWSGNPVLRSHNVTFEYINGNVEEEVTNFTFSYQYIQGDYSSGIKTASTLKELYEIIQRGTTRFIYGTKLIVTASVEGKIAFPQDSMVSYSATKYSDKLTSKIVGNKAIKTWEKIVESDISLELNPNRFRDGDKMNNNSYLVEDYNIFNDKFDKVETLKDIYDNQGKLYARLQNNQAIYYLKDNFKKVDINGVVEDGKFLYREEDKRWYLELKKPNEYALEKADGYDIGFAEGENGVSKYLQDNPKFVYGTIEIDFKSNIMDWGADTYLSNYYLGAYNGYRLKDGKEMISVCFAKSVNNIKVIINGSKEIVFNGINDSAFDAESKEGVTLYNATGASRLEITGGQSVHNGKTETHSIMFDQAVVGELKSIEIVSAD